MNGIRLLVEILIMLSDKVKTLKSWPRDQFVQLLYSTNCSCSDKRATTSSSGYCPSAAFLPVQPHCPNAETWNTITSPRMKQATYVAQNRPLWKLMSTVVGDIRTPSSACQKRSSRRRRL